jgi:hypothetical protein
MLRITNLIKIVMIEAAEDGGDCVQQLQRNLKREAQSRAASPWAYLARPSQSNVVQGNDAARCAVEVETDTAQTLQVEAWIDCHEVL